MGWIELYDTNGNKVNLEAFGLLGLRLGIPSPSYEVETQNIEGMDGEIEVSKRLLPRNLTGLFWSKAKDYQESLDRRNEINGFLGNGQGYYIAESENPGRRWKVRLGDWNPNRINSRIQEIEIPFTAKTGTSETINLQERIFTESEFQFKNEGNYEIDMRQKPETEIEFIGASSNLTIANRTTGDVWKYNGSTNTNDVILLKGVRSTKNGNSIFGQTNHKLISFAPGWNDFEISGADDFTLTIRTRFYFL